MREESRRAAALIGERTGGMPIDVGLVLGSGLAAIADRIAAPVIVRYGELAGFPRPTVGGHEAALVAGRLGTARVAVLKGRVHHYESGDMSGMRVPLETLALLGAGAIVLTNAAGSVKPEIRPGSLVAIRDHINLAGLNPLIGETGDKRFVDMREAYDPTLRQRFAVAAGETGRKMIEGVYMWFPGPSFETPAEIRAAQVLGADLVGMSTVPEAIIARRLGLRVLAISMVTNLAAGLDHAPLSHEQTMRVAAAESVTLSRILEKFFEIWVPDPRG